MSHITNVCWGTACQFVTKCTNSDVNFKGTRADGWVRHYYPTNTGEACIDYDPIRYESRWGDGSEPND
jgi:hypothetical protein